MLRTSPDNIFVCRAWSVDANLPFLDCCYRKQTEQRKLLEIELEAVGIRLNRKKPDVVLKPKNGGGITVSLPPDISRVEEERRLRKGGGQEKGR